MNNFYGYEFNENFDAANRTCAEATRPLNRVLDKYNQQLLAARQLARFRAKTRAAVGLDIAEPERGLGRNKKISSVVEELSLSLMFTGNKFPLLEDVRAELSRQLNKEVEFVYPPGKRVKFYIREAGCLRKLTEEEKAFVDKAVAGITRQKVDDNMANHPARIDNEV